MYFRTRDSLINSKIIVQQIDLIVKRFIKDYFVYLIDVLYGMGRRSRRPVKIFVFILLYLLILNKVMFRLKLLCW